MPRIEWTALPARAKEHLLDRVTAPYRARFWKRNSHVSDGGNNHRPHKDGSPKRIIGPPESLSGQRMKEGVRVEEFKNLEAGQYECVEGKGIRESA